MNLRRILMVSSMVVMAMAMTGCRVVKLSEYQALQKSHAELQDRFQDMSMQLQGAQGRESQLQSQLSEAGRKATMSEVEAARLRNQLAAAMKAKPADTPTGWQKTSTGAQISVGGDLLFSSGRAVLTSAGRSKVKQLAATIKTRYSGYLVRVSGHTDSDPIRRSGWKDNLELSSERAMAVTRELMKAGIAADKIETVAYGSAKPLGPNTSSAAKAKNRRVVIQVAR